MGAPVRRRTQHRLLRDDAVIELQLAVTTQEAFVARPDSSISALGNRGQAAGFVSGQVLYVACGRTD